VRQFATDGLDFLRPYTINCRIFIEQIHQIYCTPRQLTGVCIENVFDVSLRLFALTCIIKINYPLGAVFVMSQRDKILAAAPRRQRKNIFHAQVYFFNRQTESTTLSCGQTIEQHAATPITDSFFA
jgi:hypothetical protein